ncbi:RCC1 domain-containing protein [Haliangium sp.]|uniref:RCC1 domain-containing protein n=1 Tax=Haliangium sp. TaxID=2663208 RepID=UPI003D10E954
MLRNRSFSRALCVSVLLFSGCFDVLEPPVCPSGLQCPSATVCAANQDICISTPCGNGVIDIRAGEVCDDGNIISGDGCSRDCASNERCGNGVVDDHVGEICDDGNQLSGDGCSMDCKSSEVCGNGILDQAAGEVCDDGNRQNGDSCRSDCLSTGLCGNGSLDPGEECDANTATVACDSDCTRPICGDGHVNEAAGEKCDDAENTAACDVDCTRPSCGDGFVNPAAGEQCDPPSESCSADCQRMSCDDGVVDLGEECDEGGLDTATCDADCTRVRCGDGYRNPAVGEECDAVGNTATCNADCTIAECGDGYANGSAGEQCDTAGDSTTCNADCTTSRCGDRYVNRADGETCDEGGHDSPTCDGDCTMPRCGDGWLNLHNAEACDDGGMSAECDADCTIAECGDNYVNTAAGEQCDDGNGDDGDACVGCQNARCGDGHIRAGEEECDDGNLDNDDECTTLCTEPTCYDGIRDGGEADVDCGAVCGVSCRMSQACEGPQDCVAGTCVAGRCTPGRLAAGGAHTCIRLDTGAIRCWGFGGDGRLGYGNPNSIGDDEPASAGGDVDVGGSVVQVATGSNHTCALHTTGEIRCWGQNLDGRLGYPGVDQIGDDETPASVESVDVGGTVIQVVTGRDHACALLQTGDVRCWGHGGNGRLGYGNTSSIGDDEVPSTAGDVDVGGRVVQVAAGGVHTCALLETGHVRCWGQGRDGQLGYANAQSIGDDEAPSSAGDVDVGGTVVQITAGEKHTCALLEIGTVRCWGAGAGGVLGYGNTVSRGDDEAPSVAGDVDVGGQVIQIAAGYRHTCALLASGYVRCWGNEGIGQLGYGNVDAIGDDEVPASAGNVDVGGTVVAIAAGKGHTCALLDTGAVRCWGEELGGRLGYGNNADLGEGIGDDELPSSAGDVPYQ